jgi:hypothetical protein
MEANGVLALHQKMVISGSLTTGDPPCITLSTTSGDDLSFFTSTSTQFASLNSIPTASNNMTLFGNGNLNLWRGNFNMSAGDVNITNRSSTFNIRPGLKAGVANTSWTDLDTNGGLYIWDNVEIANNMTANSKNFTIKHPIDPSKKLIHASVEAPRSDLAYSGTVRLVQGRAVVDIDTASCPNSPMTKGTFEALTRNPRVYLQNNDGWTSVKGKVVGGKLEIEAQNRGSSDEIHWLVMAERKDEGIVKSMTTNDDGYLMTEVNA